MRHIRHFVMACSAIGILWCVPPSIGRTPQDKGEIKTQPTTGPVVIGEALEKKSLIDVAIVAAPADSVVVPFQIKSATDSQPAITTPSRRGRAQLMRVMEATYNNSRALASLDYERYKQALSGLSKIIQALDATEDYDAVVLAMALRKEISFVSSVRMLVLGEDLPTEGKFLLADPLAKESGTKFIRALLGEFPKYKRYLQEMHAPLTYKQLYALYRLTKSEATWPDSTPIKGAFFYLDTNEGIRNGNLGLDGVVVLLLEYEIKRLSLSSIVELKSALGTIPAEKDAVIAAATKHVKAVVDKSEFPFTGKPTKATQIWKMCRNGRRTWTELWKLEALSATKPAGKNFAVRTGRPGEPVRTSRLPGRGGWIGRKHLLDTNTQLLAHDHDLGGGETGVADVQLHRLADGLVQLQYRSRAELEKFADLGLDLSQADLHRQPHVQ